MIPDGCIAQKPAKKGKAAEEPAAEEADAEVEAEAAEAAPKESTKAAGAKRGRPAKAAAAAAIKATPDDDLDTTLVEGEVEAAPTKKGKAGKK